MTVERLEELQAIGIEVWKYLEDHPDIEFKMDLPKKLILKLSTLANKCPFCEYYLELQDSCYNCPLSCKKDICWSMGGIFDLWENAEYYGDVFNLPAEKIRYRSAKAIRKVFERWNIKELVK